MNDMKKRVVPINGLVSFFHWNEKNTRRCRWPMKNWKLLSIAQHIPASTHIFKLLGEPNMAMEFTLFRCGDFLENRMSGDDKNCHLLAQLSSYFEPEFIHAFYTYDLTVRHLRVSMIRVREQIDYMIRLWNDSRQRLASVSAPVIDIHPCINYTFFLHCCIQELQIVEKYTWLSVVSHSRLQVECIMNQHTNKNRPIDVISQEKSSFVIDHLLNHWIYSQQQQNTAQALSLFYLLHK